jgi:hypothetical protein
MQPVRFSGTMKKVLDTTGSLLSRLSAMLCKRIINKLYGVFVFYCLILLFTLPHYNGLVWINNIDPQAVEETRPILVQHVRTWHYNT